MMFPGLNFGIEGSVLYNNNKMDVTYMSGTDNEKIEITNHFIDIPVNAKVKFGLIAPLKIYAAAGPYAKVRIGGDDLTLKQE